MNVNLTSKSGNCCSSATLVFRQQFYYCDGRIHNASSVTELMKFPYLLPQCHPFTTLVDHVKQCHAGINGTITALRQTYQITAARQCEKKVVRQHRNIQELPIEHQIPPPSPPSRV